MPIDQATCYARAQRAFREAGFDRVDLQDEWAISGTTRMIKALIHCVGIDSRTLVDVVVAAPRGSGLAGPTRDELKGLMRLASGGGGMSLPAVVVREHWVVVANGAPRQVAYDFDVAAPASRIRVRVEGGIDDTGDGEVEVFLEEPSGYAILAESTGSDDGEWAEWSVPVRGYGRYRVVLRDLDTSDGGRYPGNGGDLEVILE